MPPRTSILRNSDERLLADCGAGDADALSHLIEFHRPGISRFARDRSTLGPTTSAPSPNDRQLQANISAHNCV
jgi:hypothetical protein